MKGNKAMRSPNIYAVPVLLMLVLPGTASAQDNFGVHICDAFLKSYEACVIAKMPAAAQPQARNALIELRVAWRALASDPVTKERFPAVCRETVELVKTQTAAIGCQW